MDKLLFHSNAPWAPTGYGMQTALFAPLLNKHYDLAISSFYGLEGSPIRWTDGIPVFPGLGNEFGNGPLIDHAARWFGGDPRDGLTLTLMDVWVLDPDMASRMNFTCWVPVDHEPAPPKVAEFFVASEAVPIAMSRFGQGMLGRLDALYCPHGVDTNVYQPIDKKTARGGAFPDDAFVIGMVAANKGRPSRKGFSQALQAFAKFSKAHDNAYLYLHTVLDPGHGAGENLRELADHLQIPMDRLRAADPYKMMLHPYAHGEMARLYASMDVLLNPAWGEGFGVPVLEAQSCGTPAIVTDFSAMREVCAAGWHVKTAAPYWTHLGSWQAIPDVDDIVSALEECYEMRPGRRAKLGKMARLHALKYDSRRVLDEFMLPSLRAAEQRFESRKPIRIPSRLKAVAA